MKILTEKIKGKKIIVSKEFIRFGLATSEDKEEGLEEVKALIEEHGGEPKTYFSSGADNLLIGKTYADHRQRNDIKEGCEAVWEKTLTDQLNTKNLPYFSDLPERFNRLMTTLFQEENICVHWIKITDGLTEADFAALEEKVKFKIPKAVKAFYSIFGSLHITWNFRNPRQRHTLNSFSETSRDRFGGSRTHYGSIQILSLELLLSKRWGTGFKGYGLNINRKHAIFDYFSRFYMAAVDIKGGADNPLVYLGSDEGESFDTDEPMTFEDYIHMTFNTYGIKGRSDYFVNHKTGNQEEQLKKLKAAIAAPIDFDFSNMEARVRLKNRIVRVGKKVLKEGNIVFADEELKYDLFKTGLVEGDYFDAEIQAANNDKETFFDRLSDAMINKEFTFEGFEEFTDCKRFQDSEEYLAIKNKPKE